MGDLHEKERIALVMARVRLALLSRVFPEDRKAAVRTYRDAAFRLAFKRAGGILPRVAGVRTPPLMLTTHGWVDQRKCLKGCGGGSR